MEDANITVQRHLTALVRTGLSAPEQLLICHALLAPTTAFFAYGCGRGGDIASLPAEGYIAQGWDPHYAADNPVVAGDVVNLGFVVNVIDDLAKQLLNHCVTALANQDHGDGQIAISMRPALEYAGFLRA